MKIIINVRGQETRWSKQRSIITIREDSSFYFLQGRTRFLRSITITEELLRDLERTKAMGKTFVSSLFFFTNICSKKIWQLFLSLFALSFVRFSFFFFLSLQYNDSFNNEIIWCNNLQFSQIIILHLTLFLLNVSLNFITMNITASIGTVNTIVSIIMPSSSRTSITVINIAVINPIPMYNIGKGRRRVRLPHSLLFFFPLSPSLPMSCHH